LALIQGDQPLKGFQRAAGLADNPTTHTDYGPLNTFLQSLCQQGTRRNRFPQHLCRILPRSNDTLEPFSALESFLKCFNQPLDFFHFCFRIQHDALSGFGHYNRPLWALHRSGDVVSKSFDFPCIDDPTQPLRQVDPTVNEQSRHCNPGKKAREKAHPFAPMNSRQMT
jgi:hypothetical protein